jgi:hypothetical protein
VVADRNAPTPQRKGRDKMKKVMLLAVVLSILFTGCTSTEADVASKNLSTSADQFQVTRRIVFYNGITGDYILVIEGLCSLGNRDPQGELSVTCKTSDNMYKKHFLGLSDNVTYFAEQIEGSPVDVYRYKVIFRPTAIVQDIDLQVP